MRNVFDQYKQPENRLTHALMTALDQDRKLLSEFLVWTTGKTPSDPKKVIVTEQCTPGEEEPSEDEIQDGRGLPDGWIQEGERWALLIDSKIEATLTNDQLNRHRKMAERRGIEKILLIAIVTEKNLQRCPPGVLLKEWKEVYEWLRERTASMWAKHVCDFMDVLESKLVEDEYLKEGTLTKFTGMPFGPDQPYTYLEAKRVLRLLMGELRQQEILAKKLGMDPRGKGRPAITGRTVGRIWDFIPLKLSKQEVAFTHCPHLTVSVQTERLVAAITIPNGLKAQYRRNLRVLSQDDFRALLKKVFERMGHLRGIKGASPKVEIIQRHYPSQRSIPITDAYLEFDLATAFPSAVTASQKRKPETKVQPQWLNVVYDVLAERKSNLQMVVGANFDYASCKEIHNDSAVALVRDTWLACAPVLDVILKGQA